MLNISFKSTQFTCSAVQFQLWHYALIICSFGQNKLYLLYVYGEDTRGLLFFVSTGDRRTK